MIHKFKGKGFNILLDVNSGSVHVIDDVTYDLLDVTQPPYASDCPDQAISCLAARYGENQVREAYDDLCELYENKLLFSLDPYKVYAQTAVKSPIKSMCLHVAHDCNLRCRYCFAATGDFGTGRKLMSLETGKAAIDFLLAHAADRENLEVDFFGGEPLLNLPVVKQIVEYAKEKGKAAGKQFRFTITTNGMLLDDEAMDYINKEMDNVVLSLDGRKQVNDRMRVCANGSGSYDKILPQFQKFAQMRKDKEYYVRGTYTKYNLDFTDDVIHLADVGFDKISVEPVIEAKQTDYALAEEDLARIDREYDRLTEEIWRLKTQGHPIDFFHFNIDLDQGPCVVKRLRGCGSGNEYVAITPDGDIYPCHQFVGITEYRMGNILENTFDEKIKEEFAGAHVYAKPACRDCWAKFYCSGGCNANNYLFHGDIFQAAELACHIQKKRLECAILMQVMERLQD